MPNIVRYPHFIVHPGSGWGAERGKTRRGRERDKRTEFKAYLSLIPDLSMPLIRRRTGMIGCGKLLVSVPYFPLSSFLFLPFRSPGQGPLTTFNVFWWGFFER